jgi:hypothetical protein
MPPLPLNPNANMHDAADMAGQGPTANPKALFTNHALLRYNGAYYDPSYGSVVAWANATQYANANVAAFQVVDLGPLVAGVLPMMKPYAGPNSPTYQLVETPQ